LELRLKGALNGPVLQRCLDEIVRRHQVLRTRFETVENHPMQVIEPAASLPMPLTDLTGLPEAAREAEAARLSGQEARRPFDLKENLMARARLFRLGPRNHILLLNFHHIATDGWSMGVIFRELRALYPAFIEGKASPLPELPFEYADYAVWQRQWLQGDVMEKQLGYWRKQLEAAPELLELPTDRSRPSTPGRRGAMMRGELPDSLVGALRELSRAEGATLSMTLMAAFQTLLHRYSGQEDLLVGSAIAGRSRTELEGLIGFFVNTLVIRGDLSGHPTFRTLLHRTREVALAAYAHQDLPFEKLVEVLRPPGGMGYPPLFQVMLVVQNTPTESAQLPDLEVTSTLLHTDTSKFDLTFFINDVGESLHMEMEYNTDLFDSGTISRMLGHFQTLLKGIVANPDQRISELPLLTESERHQLMVEWNQTGRDFPRDKRIHEVFEEQAARTPDAVAVVCAGSTLSYQELDRQANRIAQHLRARGVGPNVLAGLFIERSFEMIIGVLAVLKAGGAYWALEEHLPPERLKTMLADARPKVVLFRRQSGQPPLDLAGAHGADAPIVISIEELLETAPATTAAASSPGKATDPAYVNYTSGSTGRPKGVVVPHRGVVRLVKGVDYASLSAEDALLHLSPLSFDASTFELWGALLNGGRVVVMPPGLPTLVEIGEAIRLHGVTTAWLTAGLFHLMVDERVEDLKPLRQLLAGGDVLSPEHVRKARRALPGCRILNGYGPTENTTFTCTFAVGDESQITSAIPIGRPIANTQVYILDGNRQPVPVGVAGELYAGGDGVACGYLYDPQLTAERFLPDPFSGQAEARLYRTGDRARWRADGNIEFLGRLDEQVKIHGFRVELGEIEKVLNQHPAVRSSAVVTWLEAPGDKRLTAYVVLRHGTATPPDLRDSLRAQLPEYMVPAAFVTLEALPLTANGKVNRKALPKPDFEEAADESKFVAPDTPTEKALAKIWCDVMDLSHVGTSDNFFELGGHSLLAVRLISKINKSLNRKLSIPVFFQNPTIEQLGAVFDQESRNGRELEPVNEHATATPWVRSHGQGRRPPLFFLHGDWTGGGLYCGRLSKQLGDEQPFYTLPPYRSENQTAVTMEEMARFHIAAIREHSPHGPYLLGGYCVGATVVMEIARQLLEQGEEVAHMFLIAPPPSSSKLLRGIWPVVDRLGEILNWDLQNKIYCFDRYGVAFDRWLGKSPGSKFEALYRRLGLAGGIDSSPGADQDEDEGEGDGDKEILTSLEYAVYVLAYRLYNLKPLPVPTTLYFPEETPPSSLSRADHAGEIFPIVTIEMVPGNHRTCIIKYTSALVAKMQTTLAALPPGR
jgi:amino acid adenylation domain-containing protein